MKQSVNWSLLKEKSAPPTPMYVFLQETAHEFNRNYNDLEVKAYAYSLELSDEDSRISLGKFVYSFNLTSPLNKSVELFTIHLKKDIDRNGIFMTIVSPPVKILSPSNEFANLDELQAIINDHITYNPTWVTIIKSLIPQKEETVS
jgi:hypothetical protein